MIIDYHNCFSFHEIEMNGQPYLLLELKSPNHAEIVVSWIKIFPLRRSKVAGRTYLGDFIAMDIPNCY